MNQRHVFTLAKAPTGQAYRVLLRFCASISSEAGVVLFTRRSLRPSVANTLARLEPYLIGVTEVREYPGSSGPDLLRRYAYRPEEGLLIELFDMADGLFEWANPDLPNDLHFVRSDRSTVLATVATHDWAWLELDAAEWLQIRDDVTLSGVLPKMPDKEKSEPSHIPFEIMDD